MAVPRYGVEKFSSTGLLVSSANRGWSGLSAELRSHSDGIVARKSMQPHTEIAVDMHGNKSVVRRQAGGIFERTVAERGTVWLCPAGLQEDFVELSGPVPRILHIYLPSSHFSPDSLGVDLDQSVIASLRYESGFQDPLLAGVASAIVSELQTQTSAGRLLADTLASTLAARLVQNHLSPSPDQAFPRVTQEGLDRRRLSRVLDYIEANLEGDLTIDHLASIACLSRFHFARAFKTAVGRSPHQYVSAKRLERAKTLLIRGHQSLVDIALALNFSSQANFTRAFRQATGQTPGEYRRRSKRNDAISQDACSVGRF
ncbi:MAG: AraC family transcriptional regulator [Betaproteobacteria bacterium]|jgi:AraC family transcriptional regulator|nr:AraC family transcriptional regulator [Betaproteobacteria bacterium]